MSANLDGLSPCAFRAGHCVCAKKSCLRVMHHDDCACGVCPTEESIAKVDEMLLEAGSYRSAARDHNGNVGR